MASAKCERRDLVWLRRAVQSAFLLLFPLTCSWENGRVPPIDRVGAGCKAVLSNSDPLIMLRNLLDRHALAAGAASLVSAGRHLPVRPLVLVGWV